MIITEQVEIPVIETYSYEAANAEILNGITINGISLEDIFGGSTKEELTEEDDDESTKVTFESRLTAPALGDSNWVTTSRGGTSRCISVSSSGSTLPNCVGYAWGRWTEILGETHDLSNRNAELWWGNTGDGYERGQTPRVGAVVCWSKGAVGNGSDGAGHVAIVEEVYEDGSILISESAYSGANFYTNILSKGYNMSGYSFQGFIYLPIEFYTELELEEIAQHEMEKEMAAIRYNKEAQAIRESLSTTVRQNPISVEEEKAIKIELSLLPIQNEETKEKDIANVMYYDNRKKIIAN